MHKRLNGAFSAATHMRAFTAGPHNDAVETRAERDFGQEPGMTLEAGDEASAGAFSASTKVGCCNSRTPLGS